MVGHLTEFRMSESAIIRRTKIKIRQGFVSNSSSSSFIVATNQLTKEQIEKLMEYSLHSYDHRAEYDAGSSYYGDSWDVHKSETGGFISGFTIMDNGDMSDYMKNECQIDLNIVEWERD